jgi:hypothetical protein
LGYAALRVRVNDELEIIWKETVVAYLKVLSQFILGKTEEDHETSASVSYYSIQKLFPLS